MIKRVIALFITIVLLSSATVYASEIDFSGYSDDEILELLMDVQGEIASRKINRSAEILPGSYVVGKDVPAGTFTYYSPAEGDSWAEVSIKEFDESGKGKLKVWEVGERGKDLTLVITLNENEELRTTRLGTLTIFSGISFSDEIIPEENSNDVYTPSDGVTTDQTSIIEESVEPATTPSDEESITAEDEIIGSGVVEEATTYPTALENYQELINIPSDGSDIQILREYRLEDDSNYTKYYLIIRKNSSGDRNLDYSSTAYDTDGNILGIAKGDSYELGKDTITIIDLSFKSSVPIDHIETTFKERESNSPSYYSSLSFEETTIPDGIIFTVISNGDKKYKHYDVEGFVLFFKGDALVEVKDQYFRDLSSPGTSMEQFSSRSDYDRVEFYMRTDDF